MTETAPKTYVHAGLFNVTAADGMVYLTTPCCNASATGSVIGDRPATVCRACYCEQPSWMGMAWMADDDGGADALATLLRSVDVPMADLTADRVFIEARKDGAHA